MTLEEVKNELVRQYQEAMSNATKLRQAIAALDSPEVKPNVKSTYTVFAEVEDMPLEPEEQPHPLIEKALKELNDIPTGTYRVPPNQPIPELKAKPPKRPSEFVLEALAKHGWASSAAIQKRISDKYGAAAPSRKAIYNAIYALKQSGKIAQGSKGEYTNLNWARSGT